jgi:hypothetical protein
MLTGRRDASVKGIRPPMRSPPFGLATQVYTYYAASRLVACLFSMWIFSGINDDKAYDPKQAVDD